MRPFQHILIAITAATLLNGCAAGTQVQASSGTSGEFIFVPPMDIYETIECIALDNVRSMQIIDRTAIAYEMPDRKIWINRPRWGAASLDNDLVMITGEEDRRLCAGDIIHFIEHSPRGGRSSVALGQFVSYAPTAQEPGYQLNATALGR